MRRMNNLITLFSAIFAFFFGCFLTSTLIGIEKCQPKYPSKLDQNHDIFLIILVLSAPNYFERRQIIRDTWMRLAQPLMQPYYPEDFIYVPDYDDDGFLIPESVAEQSNRMRIFLDWMSGLQNSVGNKRSFKIKPVFALGTKSLSPAMKGKINDEQKSYGDLLILPELHDLYQNLTQKLITSIETLTTHYSFSYILKVDDDTYVKLDYLLNELVSFDRKLIRRSGDYVNDPLPELYWGFFNGRAMIKTKGQWREPHYYLCNRYAPYALGGGYVISRTIAEFIEANSKLLSTYVSEDVSMGTWLSPLRNVYRRHDARFDTAYMPRKCKTSHIVLHKRSVEHMKDIYEGRLCTFESKNEAVVRRPAEYYYDWSKPADKCCDSLV